MELREVHGIPDYSVIEDLIVAEWPSEFGDQNPAEMIQEMTKSHILEADTTKYLVEKEEIIGFYRYTRIPRDQKNTKLAHILDIAILPEYQKKGIGKMMMQDIIEDSKLRGYEKLQSRSFRSNLGSIALHKRMGFYQFLETDDSLVWELELR